MLRLEHKLLSNVYMNLVACQKQESERQYRTSTVFTISEEKSQNIISCSTLCGTDITAWNQEFMESILFTFFFRKYRVQHCVIHQ